MSDMDRTLEKRWNGGGKVGCKAIDSDLSCLFILSMALSLSLSHSFLCAPAFDRVGEDRLVVANFLPAFIT